jgi:hypothetical protein
LLEDKCHFPENSEEVVMKTCNITEYSRVLEKGNFEHLVKKLSALYKTQMFTTVFTTARRRAILGQINPIYPHSLYL